MATREELAQLRREAVRAMNLSKRKRNRILKELQTPTLGKYEPRIVGPEKIQGYTAKQLESLIAQSEQFRSRRTQFKPLAGRQPVPVQQWRKFDRAQRRRQAQQRQAQESVADVYLPTLGQTVGERRDMVSPPRARRMEGTLNVEDDLRPSTSIVSERSLRKLTRQLERENQGTPQRKARARAMKSLDQMFPYMTGPEGAEIEQEIRSLSDDQFFTLWNVRDFMDDASNYYFAMKTLQSDSISASKQNALEDSAKEYRAELRGLIRDVKQIPGKGRRF